jgi:hypothetical protein
LTTAFGVIAFAVYVWPVRPRRDDEERVLAAVAVDASRSAAPEGGRLPMPRVEVEQRVGWSVVGHTNPADAIRPPWLQRSATGDDMVRAARVSERFDSPATPGVARHTITYRWVRISDGPDERASNEIGRVDRGDEVEVIDEDERALKIRTPGGLVGWIPRMVIVG